MPAYPGIPPWSTNLKRHCQHLCVLLTGGPMGSVFLCMERLFLLTSPLPPRTEGSLWLCGGEEWAWRQKVGPQTRPAVCRRLLEMERGPGLWVGWLGLSQAGLGWWAGWRLHRDGEWGADQGNWEGFGVPPSGLAKSQTQISQPQPVTTVQSWPVLSEL